MSTSTQKADIPFIADVKNVKEVILLAEADLAFWQERLRAEALFPYSSNGKAELMISATALTWMGARSHELTIGIPVCLDQAASAPDGMYLLQAFNSSRLFAFVERAFFRTPYDPGRIQLAERVPARIELRDAQGPIFTADMNGSRPPARSEDELWQGTIFLPRDKSQQPERFFVARLGGYTVAYPFAPAHDALTLAPRAAHPVFQWLQESNIAGKEWRIRSDARHARSKTFTRR